MTSALAPFTRIAPSASVSGDGLVTHALNLRAIRAAKAGFIIVRNSGKSPSYLSEASMSAACTYSRIDRAHFPFAVAIANLGAASRRTSLENLAGSPSGFPAPFGRLS